MLSAGVDMLQHLGHQKHASLIQRAIFKTIFEDKIHTPDLGGTVVQRIIDHFLQFDIISRFPTHYCLIIYATSYEMCYFM